MQPAIHALFQRMRSASSFQLIGLGTIYACWASWGFSWLGFYELNPDEGINLAKGALVAAGFELYQDIWSDQPPVLTYALAAVQQVSPWNVTAARLLVLSSACLLLTSFYAIIRRRHGTQVAVWSAVLLMTAPLFIKLSVSVMVGLPAVALAMLSLDLATRPRPGWLIRAILAGLILAVSLQTKFFVILMGPAVALALVQSLPGDPSSQPRRWITALATFGLACALGFMLIAVVSGQAFIDQLIHPHFSTELRNRYSLTDSADTVWQVLSRQQTLLLFGLVGLLLNGKRMLQTMPLAALWLVATAAGLLSHTPVWPHHTLLLLPPLAWFGGMAWAWLINRLQSGHARGRRHLVTPAVIAAVGLSGGLAMKSRTLERNDALKISGHDAISRFAGLGGWVVTDTPMDAFRAGMLVPPELAVYTWKRVTIGELTASKVIRVMENRHPQQVLLRRFQPDPQLQSYLEANFLQTSHGPGFSHYLAKTAPSPKWSHDAVTTLLDNMVGEFVTTGVNGAYAGVISTSHGKRFGENLSMHIGADSAFMRPPGSTPRIGQCYLRSYQITGNRHYLQLAREVARATVRTQHCTGGWEYEAVEHSQCLGKQIPVKNRLSFDEGMVAEAIDFLLDMKSMPHPTPDPWLEQAAINALDFLVATQLPHGGWPYDFSSKSYAHHATINDDISTSHIRTLDRAYALFGHQRYAHAVDRGIDFLLRSQSTQGGWAQQYDDQLKAAPARSFEPVALSSLETAYVIGTLLKVNEGRNDPRISAAVQRASRWLKQVALGPSRWARYYQIGTNQPLYVDRSGRVYDSVAELPAERRYGYRWEGYFPEVAHAMALADANSTQASTPIDLTRRRLSAISRAELLSKARVFMNSGPLQHSSLKDKQGNIWSKDFIERCKMAHVLLNDPEENTPRAIRADYLFRH